MGTARVEAGQPVLAQRQSDVTGKPAGTGAQPLATATIAFFDAGSLAAAGNSTSTLPGAELLATLNPAVVAILGEPETTAAAVGVAKQYMKGQPIEILAPGCDVTPGAPMAVLNLRNAAALIYICTESLTSEAAIPAEAGDNHRSLLLELLSARLAAMPPAMPVICLLNAEGEGPQAGIFRELEDVLVAAGRPAAVIIAGGKQFLWWRSRQVDYVTLGPVACPQRTMARAESPCISGFLWVLAGPARGIEFAVIGNRAVHPIGDIARHVQTMIDAITDSVQATPIDAFDPSTLITVSNPTSQPLTFDTHWEFALETMSVEPQIVGFELAPGETFTQQFRFDYDRSRRLKVAQPRFVLRTRLRENGGRDLELSAEPWCRAVGTVQALKELPSLDSGIEAASLLPYRVSLEKQVVENRDAWNGPQDLSAIVYAGHGTGWVYLAAAVTDDGLHAGADGDELELAVNLAGAAESGEGDVHERILKITFRPDGFSSVSGVADIPGQPIRTAVERNPSGYTVQAVIPTAYFTAARLGSVLRFDIVMRDSDAMKPSPVFMAFSGNSPDAAADPDLFAVFRVNGEDLQE
jgi:hypothetical protein